MEEGAENDLQRGDNPATFNPTLQRGDNPATQEPTKLWAKDYSHTFLKTEEHLLNAFKYIENNHLKHQLKELDYKYKNLTPLEKAFEKKVVPGGFDVVIGNPPYVQLNMLDINIQKYLLANYTANTDLYSIFVEKSFNLVKNNDFISFIIPNLFIKGVNYKRLRDVINKNSENVEIKDYGDGVFFGVKMPTCVCSFTKGESHKDHFKNKSEFIFKKILTTSLHEISLIRRGLEIGRDKLNESGSIVCLNGGDIASYQIKNKHYISEETFNAFSKNKEIFKSPKIIVRETGNKFFATLENDNFITNRSLYNVIINNVNYNPKLILGIINSKLFVFYFNEFVSAGTNIFPKIRIAQLNEIPIPNFQLIKKHTHDQIVNSVVQLLQLNKDLHSATLETKKEQIKQKIEYHEDKINKFVYQLYDLTEEEIELVEGS